MNTLADSMKNFLDTNSSIDGAEFPSTDSSRSVVIFLEVCETD